MRDDLIGLDLGQVTSAAERAAAAAEAGARLARVRLALGSRPFLDSQFLDTARRQVAELRAAGLTVMAVVDSDLTVAPAGAGAFSESPYDMLARAWVDEMVTNAGALAAVLGPDVSLWELLPTPNAGQPAPRIAPSRWAELVARLAQAIRSAAPGAHIVAGGLQSDEADDAVDYLRMAMTAGAGTGSWPAGVPPVDYVGLALAILPDGGSSEDAVAGAVRDRLERLWRAQVQTAGGHEDGLPRLFVTQVGWDAARCGEAVQSRNVWTALDTLSTSPAVMGAVWTQLQDDGDAKLGLYRADGLSLADRRPSGQAYADFTHYLRQISAPPALDWLAEPDPSATEGLAAAANLPEPEIYPAPPAHDDTVALLALLGAAANLPEPEVFPAPEADLAAAELGAAAEAASELPGEPMVDRPGLAAAAVVAAMADHPEDDETAPVDEPLMGEPEPEIFPPNPTPYVAAGLVAAAAVSDETSATPEPAEVVFRIPSAADVLRAQGLDDELLALALAALAAQHGDPDKLGPGEYRVRLLDDATLDEATTDETTPDETTPDEATAAEPSLPCTNQQMISALYRAAGGSWVLFERTGLVLSDLAARRNEPYAGADPAELPNLSADERQAVAAELGRIVAAPTV
jgi:hypothetical protein